MAAPIEADDGSGSEDIIAGDGEEVVAERTEETKTFATETPGVFRTEVYTEPVHYQDASGAWTDLDPALVAGDEAGSFATEGTPTTTTVVADDDSTRVTVDLGGGTSAGFELASGSIAPAGDAVEVDGVAAGVDVELEATASGLKETLVLASPDTPRRFEFPLELDGLTASLSANGGVSLLDASGAVVGVIPPGWMADSSAHPVTGVPAESFAVEYSLEGTPTGPVLAVSLDDAWLDDPARVYPVRVDPSVLQANAGLDDTYVVAYAPADRSSLTQLQVGHNGYLGTRSFLKFPDLAQLDGKIVHFAELKLFQNGGGSCTPTPMGVHAVTAPWSGSTVTSWGGPAVAVPASSRVSSAHGVTGCASDWVEVNVTDLVDDWATGYRPNHGLSLQAITESAPSHFKRFASGNSAWTPPHVQVVWSDPSLQAPFLTAMVDEPSPATVRPMLSALYRDPAHRAGIASFVVLDEEGNWLVAGASPRTLSGDTASWRVPAGYLRPGMAYSVIAFATNNLNLSSTNTSARHVSISDVAFTDLVDDEVHFGEATFGAVAADGLIVDRVDLMAGSTLLASDATAPYELTWDTALTPDGATEVTAVGHVGTDLTDAATMTIDVRNQTTGAQRADLDRLTGRLTQDQAALITVQAAMGDPSTPARYQSELSSASTADVVGLMTEYGNDLSATTKDAIADLLEPLRFPGRFRRRGGLRDPGPGRDQPGRPPHDVLRLPRPCQRSPALDRVLLLDRRQPPRPSG